MIYFNCLFNYVYFKLFNVFYFIVFLILTMFIQQVKIDKHLNLLFICEKYLLK